MDNTFRLVGPQQDELLLSRLLVHAQIKGERFYGGFELQDSRAWLEQDLTPVGTDDVNAPGAPPPSNTAYAYISTAMAF